MQANTNVMGNEAQAPSVDWEEARCWAAGHLNKERVKAAGMVVAGFAAFVGLLGVVQYAMYQLVQNWTITGAGASVVGFF